MNAVRYILSFPSEVAALIEKETLQNAVDRGDLEVVKKFIDNGHDVNQPMENGHLPLHAAVRLGNPALTKFLVERGADVTQLDPEKLSALDYAAFNPNQDLLLALLSFAPKKTATLWESIFGKKVASYEFAPKENVKKTQSEIDSYRNNLKGASDDLSTAILAGDISKLETLLKTFSIVKLEHLALALFLNNDKIIELLFQHLPRDVNREIEGQRFNLVQLAASTNNSYLKKLVLKGGDLQKKNPDGVSAADLLFAQSPSKDPLPISKAKCILTLLGLSVIFYENMVEPVLSRENAAFLKGALFLLNLSTEVALNTQLYLQLNPQTLFQKAMFWGSNLATIPMHMGIAMVPPLKVTWDLWRCYQVTTNAFHELKRSFYHAPYDKKKALAHASLQIMTVGSTYYHCRKSAQMVRDFVSSLFEEPRYSPPPVKTQPAPKPKKHEEASFCGKDGYRTSIPKDLAFSATSNIEVYRAISNLEDQAEDLKFRVELALETGGKVERGTATNGLYHILDHKGNIIAFFKPESERMLGPESWTGERKANPTMEDIHFHQMDSFEQGMLTHKQYFSKVLDHGKQANLPLGTIVEMESDKFNNVGGERCKIGYLQEYVPSRPMPPDQMEDRMTLDEFQKLGIMDVQLYNQDRHSDNLLLTPENRVVNIDSDAILPYRLENNRNPLLQSERAKLPFTEESLRTIAKIDPKFNAELARTLGLPLQCSFNAEILASTLKNYAAHGRTLSDINEYIGSNNRDMPCLPDKLWSKIEMADGAALAALSPEDQAHYKHFEHIRYLKWMKENTDRDDEWWYNYFKLHDERIRGIMNKGFSAAFNAPSERKITFGTTYIPGNPLRDEMSALVDANHKEYADKWKLTHRTVTQNLLQDQCSVYGEPRTCSPYWNKIKVLKDWLETKTPDSRLDTEEWYVMADDDMVVTNLNINPYKAIDELRMDENKIVLDTSFIVAKDVQDYSRNPTASVNTGLLFVRKDEAAAKLINDIWEGRNDWPRRPTDYCPTYGVCEKQATLHEQDVLCNIIKSRGNSLIDRVLTVVSPRDASSPTRGHIALNTFERSGNFMNTLWGHSECVDFNDPQEGRWRAGDWMGQTAGVPVEGVRCHETEKRRLRQEKIEAMLKQVEGRSPPPAATLPQQKSLWEQIVGVFADN